MIPKKRKENPIEALDGKRIYIPILFGLGIVAILLFRNFDKEAFQHFPITTRALFFLLLAVLFMVFRDVGYMIRIRILTRQKLKWKQSFRVIMLWEFASAVMPSAVGGTTIAMIFVNKEGINLGKSTAVVMATSFLDELYFILMFPLLLLIIKIPTLFAVGIVGESFSWTNEFLWFAVIGYSLKLVYTIVLSYGLFVNPRGLKWLLLWVFKLPFLRRFRYNAHLTGTDIITSSRELKAQSFWFWIKAFTATFLSWTSRYFVVNAIMLAFFTVSDHFLLFARQLVMSNMMLIMPTPGASGFSELIFKSYLKDFIPLTGNVADTSAVLLSFIWRLVSFYPYLLIGTLILPAWVRKHFRRHAKAS